MSRHSERPCLELEELVAAFALWRATRRTLTGATPEPLRRRVVALLDAHRPATLARALAINPTAIERWAEELPPASPVTASAPFVALPADNDGADASTPCMTPVAPSLDALPKLTLRWPGGATLVARGAIPEATLAAILEAFTQSGAAARQGHR